jgi:hypothetical protein
MYEETKAAFSTELVALCRKYNVSICCGTDSAGVANGGIEITRVVKREGKCPREETLFMCDEINELGIF